MSISEAKKERAAWEAERDGLKGFARRPERANCKTGSPGRMRRSAARRKSCPALSGGTVTGACRTCTMHTMNQGKHTRHIRKKWQSGKGLMGKADGKKQARRLQGQASLTG